MTTPDSMFRVPAHRKPRPEGPLTPAQAAGEVADWLLDYRGLTRTEAAQRQTKLSISSIRRITIGFEGVGVGLYRALAGVLRIPPDTFELMLDGNVKALQSLVMLRPEEDEPVRIKILDAMKRVDLPRRRRAADAPRPLDHE